MWMNNPSKIKSVANNVFDRVFLLITILIWYKLNFRFILLESSAKANTSVRIGIESVLKDTLTTLEHFTAARNHYVSSRYLEAYL